MKFLKSFFAIALLFAYSFLAYGQEDSISTVTENGYQAKTWSNGVEDFSMRIVSDTSKNGTHSQSFYFRGEGGSYVEVEKNLPGFIQPTNPAEFSISFYNKRILPVVNNLSTRVTIWVGDNTTWYEIGMTGAASLNAWISVVLYPSVAPPPFNRVKIRFSPQFTPPSTQMVTWEVFLDFFYVSHLGGGFVRWIDDFGDGMVGVPSVNNEIPKEFSLKQNYPNPFNPETKIEFAIPKKGNVKISVLDILGKEVSILTDEVYSVGNHAIDFNAASLSSGIYFYRLETEGFTSVKKMILVK
jgi:hypothetical protein